MSLGSGVSPAAANASGGMAASGDDASSGQAFSQLLGDLGAHAEGHGAQNFSRGQLLPAGAAHAALTAQEIDLEGLLPQPIAEDRLITAEDAASILQRVEAALSHGDAGIDTAVLTQMKGALQQMIDSGAPRTVAELAEAVPDFKGSKLPWLLVSALQHNKKSESHLSTEEEPHHVLAAMQNIPANFFRTHRGEASSAATAAAEQKKKGRDFVETVTVIEPTAFATAVPVASSVDAGADDAVGELHARAELDRLVPPLKPEKLNDLPAVDLPDVTLPSAAVSAAASASVRTPEAAELTKREELSINSLLGIEASSSSADGAYPMALPTHGAVHTTSVSKPVDIIPTHGFVNQAPVSEQVHVAIRQASHDGVGRITIQLDPIDLGRVEVNMQTSKDGVTQIYFTVDKPETFDSLSRDVRLLERSLQEAGIKSDAGSMQFNLRQQPQPQMQSDLDGQRQPSQQQAQAEEESQQAAITGVQNLAALTRNYLFNVREGVDISA